LCLFISKNAILHEKQLWQQLLMIEFEHIHLAFL